MLGMKKKLLLGIALATGSFAMSQTFFYPLGQTTDNELIGNDYVMATVEIVTPDSSAITFAWESVSNTLPMGWDYSMCDYETCYPGVPATGLMSPISAAEFASGLKGFLKVTASALSISGMGSVEIYVYDQANYTNGDTVTFNFNTPGAGLNDAELASVSVYPNPTTDYLFVENAQDISIDVEIFNVSGTLVYNSRIADDSKEKLDLSDLNSGIYFLHLVAPEGLHATRKIIIR
jgi:hypothetical protein